MAFDFRDNPGDLVVGPAVRALPGAPLFAVDGTEFAIGVRPLVPDADAILLQITDVSIAVKEPDEFVDDRLQMQPLGGEQRKAGAEIEAQLAAKQRANARACPVALDGAVG